MKMNYKVILIVIVAIIGTVLACRYISTPKNKENFAIGFHRDNRTNATRSGERFVGGFLNVFVDREDDVVAGSRGRDTRDFAQKF